MEVTFSIEVFETKKGFSGIVKRSDRKESLGFLDSATGRIQDPWGDSYNNIPMYRSEKHLLQDFVDFCESEKCKVKQPTVGKRFKYDNGLQYMGTVTLYGDMCVGN